MTRQTRAQNIQKELAVLVVRHEDVKRRLEALQRIMVEQDARLVALRDRVFGQGAARGHEVSEGGPPDPPPWGWPTDPPLGPEQEGDGVRPARPSHVRALRPSAAGPVTAGLLALLGPPETAGDR